MKSNLKVILSSLGIAAMLISPVLAKSHHEHRVAPATVHSPSTPDIPSSTHGQDFQDQAGRGGPDPDRAVRNPLSNGEYLRQSIASKGPVWPAACPFEACPVIQSYRTRKMPDRPGGFGKFRT